MKYLVFSDLHVHPHKRYATEVSAGLTTRTLDAVGVLRQMREYAVKHEIKHFLFAGDLFDAKARTPIATVNAVLEEFLLWQSREFEVCLLAGNHDYITRDGKEHALTLFQHLKRFRVLDNNNTSPFLFGDLKVYPAPFKEIFDYKSFPKHFHQKSVASCDTPSTTPKSLLLAHGCLEGLCELPFALPEDPTQEFNEWIRESWLEGFDYAVVGHVHQMAHKIYSFHSAMEGTRHCFALQTGQPYQFDWRDEKEFKGFWVLDTDAPTTPTLREDDALSPFLFIPSNAPTFKTWLIEEETTAKEIIEFLYNKGVISKYGSYNFRCILRLKPTNPNQESKAQEIAQAIQQETFHLNQQGNGLAFVEALPYEADEKEIKQSSSVRLDSLEQDEQQQPYDLFKKALGSGFLYVSCSFNEQEKEEILQKAKNILEKSD